MPQENEKNKKPPKKQGKSSSSKAGADPASSQGERSPDSIPSEPLDPQAHATSADLPQSDPREMPFAPKVLDKTVIALPLLEILKKEDEEEDEEREQARQENREFEPKVHSVIIDLNLEHRGGQKHARKLVEKMVKQLVQHDPKQGINKILSRRSQQYLFADLKGSTIRELVKQDNAVGEGAVAAQRAIYHIWPDFEIEAFINKSISTVKADAARSAFAALGEGIVWAVLDSGIDEEHPHFKMHENLKLDGSLKSLDFTVRSDSESRPHKDEAGHGTHVAGIIAGEIDVKPVTSGVQAKEVGDRQEITAVARQRDELGEVSFQTIKLNQISGMAPKCKLLSLKVLDGNGKGKTSSIIAAIYYIQEINGYGRRLRIHGVNLSVGYDFEPKWFACGQSPLCIEVDRLVRSGVVVVVSAGNTGYGSLVSDGRGVISAGMDLTINDPGNAELAITVGSTHRDMPHIYGVSYFSSKGPTGDGRLKPDLVAPGEKILSCAAGKLKQEVQSAGNVECTYVENSGTSMAAPHVSGVIAAFLSVRQEFIGRPEEVKQIFLSTATDLKRERYFQGYGLVDLMRAIQSV